MTIGGLSARGKEKTVAEPILNRLNAEHDAQPSAPATGTWKTTEAAAPRRTRHSAPIAARDAHAQTYIALIDVNPHWVHAHWTMSEADAEWARQHSGRPVIRVYDVTHIVFDGENAHCWFDMEVGERDTSWYINILAPGRSVIADVGIRSPKGEFLALARSSCAQLPAAGDHQSGETRWMCVNGRSGERKHVRDEATVVFPRKCGELPELGRDGVTCELLMKVIGRFEVLDFYNDLWSSCRNGI